MEIINHAAHHYWMKEEAWQEKHEPVSDDVEDWYLRRLAYATALANKAEQMLSDSMLTEQRVLAIVFAELPEVAQDWEFPFLIDCWKYGPQLRVYVEGRYSDRSIPTITHRSPFS